MRTSSPGVKDLHPPLTIVHHHNPSCLGTQCQPRGVDQGPPPAKRVVAGEGPGGARGGAGLLPIIQLKQELQPRRWVMCTRVSQSETMVPYLGMLMISLRKHRHRREVKLKKVHTSVVGFYHSRSRCY
uniref:Uncharacterized protein n=1 Tax=Castor canadensis TaxID=51338 RepID=A0A8C0XTF1_CASCN